MSIIGHKTYFIEGRQSQPREDNQCLNITNPMPLKLIISPPQTTDYLSPAPNALLSPNFDNLNPNPNLSFPLTPPLSNPNHLSPNSFNLKIKANSLPSILDSDNEDDRNIGKNIDDDLSKSPISAGDIFIYYHFKLYLICIMKQFFSTLKFQFFIYRQLRKIRK